jgi:hypothetical protein
MKFLAVLKDSLREAIDTKVFYVMVGLSVLLTLGTATLTFTPKESGQDFMKIAAAPLSIENLSELQGAGPEEWMRALAQNRQGRYEPVLIEPLDGATDGPASRFRLVLRAIRLQASERKKMKEDPGPTIEHIRNHFGAIDNLRMVAVEDVKAVDRPPGVPTRGRGEAFFEVTTRPTAATLRLWPHTWSLFLGGWAPTETTAPLGLQLYLLEEVMLGWVGASVAILLSIVITAFFIPNMLRKGTVDLLIVKPIHRTTLLLYKYVGGLLFILLNTAVAVTGVWLALGVRSGVWAPSVFWMVPLLTFSFAILYAVSTLFGVLTRSAIVAILMTVTAWAVFFVVSLIHLYWDSVRIDEQRRKVAVEERRSEGLFPRIIDGIHYVLPRRDDLGTLTSRLLVRDLLTANQIQTEKLDKRQVSWTESLTVSCLFIAVMLGLSCWWFARKDY